MPQQEQSDLPLPGFQVSHKENSEAAFCLYGPKLWSTLLSDLRMTGSLVIFKKKYKTDLFNLAFNTGRYFFCHCYCYFLLMFEITIIYYIILYSSTVLTGTGTWAHCATFIFYLKTNNKIKGQC